MRNQRGTAMLALIIAMVVTSVLTAAIVVINTASNIGAAKSTNFTKALYLAEAGVRYGADRPPGPEITYTLSDSYQQMSVQTLVGGSVRSTGIAYPGTVYEARMTITRGGGAGASPAPETDTREHNRNILPLAPATFTDDLGAFDLTGIESRIKLQAYLATSGSHAWWAALKNFTTNTINDSDGCTISCLFIPISQTYVDYLRNSYNAYGTVSYSIQTKVGWLYTVKYAAQGINFRWHESSPGSGLYQGYAVSFMVFKSKTVCSNDYIPNNIKPGSGNSLKERLLLVLWKQEVVGGVETRKWLAYAELGRPAGVCIPPASRTPPDNDQMVTGWQIWYDGRVTDDASIGVRVDDVVWGETHYNEIKVFYGDGSPNFDSDSRRVADANATNTHRRRYYPQWIEGQYFTTWPSHYFENLSPTDNTLTYWSYCPWIRSVSYVTAIPDVIGNPPEIAIPTARMASDGQPHNYVVTQDGTSGLTEPVWPVTSSATVSDGTVVWQENGVARPTSRYDWFTVLNANPQGTNHEVEWIPNPDAVDEGIIKLASDKSTIRTYEFPLNSFPDGRKEIGLHGMVNADSVPLAFDDLSLIIMGKKE